MSKSKARRAKAQRFTTDVEPLVERHGCAMQIINPEIHQFRITGPLGGSVEFYASTHKWCCTHDSVLRGVGTETMFAFLATVERPAPREEERSALVSIFADAAYERSSGSAGYGYWIKGEGPSISGGGPMATMPPTSTEAEALAIAYALHLAITSGVLKDGGHAMLQSDCQPMLSALMRRFPGTQSSKAKATDLGVTPARRLARSFQESGAFQLIDTILKNHGIRLSVRHVRGHDPIFSGRAYVNELCDTNARQGAAQARQLLRRRSAA